MWRRFEVIMRLLLRNVSVAGEGLTTLKSEQSSPKPYWVLLELEKKPVFTFNEICCSYIYLYPHLAAYKLYDFRVSMSNRKYTSLQDSDLNNSDLKSCGKYSGKPPEASIVVRSCSNWATGRYLYIYTTVGWELELCEVEVFEIVSSSGSGSGSGKHRFPRDFVHAPVTL